MCRWLGDVIIQYQFDNKPNDNRSRLFYYYTCYTNGTKDLDGEQPIDTLTMHLFLHIHVLRNSLIVKGQGHYFLNNQGERRYASYRQACRIQYRRRRCCRPYPVRECL